MNGEYRNSNDVGTYYDNNTIKTLSGIAPLSMPAGKAALLSSPGSLSLLSSPDALLSALAEADIPGKGLQSNWKPVAVRSDYAAGAANAVGLRPAIYMVHATRQMADWDIVSSVSAHIALSDMYDNDQDAVLTREIPTFTNPPEPIDPGRIVQQDSFVEHAIGNGIVFRGGHWVDQSGNRVRVGRGGPAGTGDTMALGLWFVIMVITLICLILLRMTYGAGRRRKENGGDVRCKRRS
jgi:hypothetical protein